MIEMTTPGEDLYVGGIFQKEKIASFSPDRTHFIIVLKRGDLADNAVHYEIRLFDAAAAMKANGGTIILERDSSTNRPALEQVKWADNDTLTFIARGSRERSAVYSMDIYTRTLKPLAQSDGNIYSYAIDADKRIITFLAQQKSDNTLTAEEQHEGVDISTQSLFGLLTNRYHFDEDFFADLYVRSLVTGKGRRIVAIGRILAWQPLALSPDGKHLVVETYISHDLPPIWNHYLDPMLLSQLNVVRHDTSQLFVGEFLLVDLKTGSSRPLLNSPTPMGVQPDVLWSPDSKSVALAGIFLPLDASNQISDEVRRRTKFVAEVSIESGKVSPISTEAVELLKWEKGSDRLFTRKGRWEAGDVDAGADIVFSKHNAEWHVDSSVCAEMERSSSVSVTLKQGMNEPPKVIATDTETGLRHVVLDLNPQFQRLEFGRVEDLGHINNRDIPVDAGIYLPVGYVSGKKYPLIIQTHGWDPEQFWIDGPFTTAAAAQVFAGHGFVVAQVAQNRNDKNTLPNIREEAANYDALIDILVRRGMVDESRIGIIGFSVTGWGVKYALTHSRYHFAAATLADPSDGGYFKYLALLNSFPAMGNILERINGGLPVGDGIQKWIATGLGFGVERITTPLRLETNAPESLFSNWETFTLLQRLNSPVDFVLIPDGDHVLIKPWNRLASQGGNVDWFRFWLQGYADPNPEKTRQYHRWEGLCSLQRSTSKELPSQCIEATHNRLH
ncbi:hypothetical protein GCM10011585_32960 [Edaphobacter dinghuensis]|uniref:Dipeptidyl aminopeptidase/acylaminoacyl peptidase n=2 Tax=Edaphobacter dinghuensis TaxID=1560005 RepID=A0A917HPT2_9BACT|nr:hypothetical protein GCM10011585_32960 [Edaphobacter dinghuensis]